MLQSEYNNSYLIYLHRNQIVHSGKFINEYSNLCSHLEWYIGKLLSYCVLSYIKLDDKSKFNKAAIFYELEAHSENIKNQLKNNSDKKINAISMGLSEKLRAKVSTYSKPSASRKTKVSINENKEV